jgi:hypothetical protein
MHRVEWTVVTRRLYRQRFPKRLFPLSYMGYHREVTRET